MSLSVELRDTSESRTLWFDVTGAEAIQGEWGDQRYFLPDKLMISYSTNNRRAEKARVQVSGHVLKKNGEPGKSRSHNSFFKSDWPEWVVDLVRKHR